MIAFVLPHTIKECKHSESHPNFVAVRFWTVTQTVPIQDRFMEASAAIITWFDVIKLALTTGLVATALNQAVTWLRTHFAEKRLRHRDATYLALRVAVILEQFAIECANQISTHDAYKASSGQIGSEQIEIPDLAEYPENLSWNTVDNILCERILTFRNELRIGQSRLPTFADIAPEQVPDLCDEECAVLGHRSVVLATDLRENYGVPKTSTPSVKWNYAETLKQEHDRVLDGRANDVFNR